MFKVIFLLVVAISNLTASLHDKSAMVYYGKDISYSMVGIHDYIIVQPENINTLSHGFSLYKEKMYAYVSIGEIDRTIKEYAKVKKEWIMSENKEWQSDVLDIKNLEYQEFVFKELIEPRVEEGFVNFFFDTLDSYNFYSQDTLQRERNKIALAKFINEFHRRYPNAKLITNRGFEIIDAIHDSLEAVLFESYYKGLGGESGYKDMSNSDRAWLDIQIDKIHSYGLEVISVDYLPADELESKSIEVVEKLKQRGLIPYIANRELTIYGKSSKNAIKREIFTLIDEGKLDRTLSEAHQLGAVVFEYMGYEQKLYNIRKGLPSMNDMRHYAGVVMWLDSLYESPKELMSWVQELSSIGVKVAFVRHFGVKSSSKYLKKIGVKVKPSLNKRVAIESKDAMMGYDIEPSLALSYSQIKSKATLKPLLSYKLSNADISTVAAITIWGGYALEDGFMVEIDKDRLWVINPFKFFKEALRLPELIVPDVTTENGKRLFFTHIDGDGIMNRVEGDSSKFSGEVILEDILKKYKVPHSVSVIGAEIEPYGLYPNLSNKMISIAKKMYALENVEGATHTFTHPFKWGKIEDGNLSQEYRLKVKGYDFSFRHELLDTTDRINNDLTPKDKAHSRMVFWSGDCAPRKNALEYVHKNGILNINGGDTYITKTKPWLSYIAPLGLERDGYYQVYTGAQNENVFTNNWLGPFWRFKKVTQTFELTNSPRRFKPIDIYYHLYSGSKMASLRALQYVFDWSLQQDIMPIFTSEYIPKVMDFYDVSMAKEGDEWLFDGMRDLKTLRIEREKASIDFKASPSALGIKHFENHTYVSLGNSQKHFIKEGRDDAYKNSTYLISSNAKSVDFKNSGARREISFQGHVDLELEFHIGSECSLSSYPKPSQVKQDSQNVKLFYRKEKSAQINIDCKEY